MIKESLVLYVMFTTYRYAGVYDLEWGIFDITTRFFVSVPIGVILGSTDSWRMKRRYKAGLLAIAIFYYAYEWVNHRFISKMWPATTCAWNHCANSKHYFQTMQLQIILFVSNAVVQYLQGYPVAFVRPSYCKRKHKSTEVATSFSGTSAQIADGTPSTTEVAASELALMVANDASQTSQTGRVDPANMISKVEVPTSDLALLAASSESLASRADQDLSTAKAPWMAQAPDKLSHFSL